LSDATVLAIDEEARALIAPTLSALGDALKTVPVAHAEETAMRVAGKLFWRPVLATRTLTWIGTHMNRGKKAFDAFGISAVFAGTSAHDGWKPYRDLARTHALCNAHHLRELTYVFEQMKQAWAKPLIDLLVGACHEVAAAGGSLADERIAQLPRCAYAEILAQGAAVEARAAPSGKRGRTKQNKALHLLDRLRARTDDVWRFLADYNVPFSDNAAEQAVRMPKVKQKISGGLRTQAGLETFCTIRSYLATLHKQGANLFHPLTLTFQGAPPQPRFA
jgi:transposase